MAERATHWAEVAAELAAETWGEVAEVAAEVAEVAAEVSEVAAEDKWSTLHHHCKSCDRSLNYWCVAVAARNVNAYILKIKSAISLSNHGKQVPQLLVQAMLGRLAGAADRGRGSSGAAAAVEGRSSGRQRRAGLRGAAMT